MSNEIHTGNHSSEEMGNEGIKQDITGNKYLVNLNENSEGKDFEFQTNRSNLDQKS